MNRVDRLKRIKGEMEHLAREERRLSVPIVANIGMIRNLYDVYCVSLKRQDPEADPTDTDNRKKFLYAAIYVCSPSTLVGNVMRHRLRECISAVIGCAPTGVSRDYKTAIFFYETYSSFKNSVDGIIKDMLEAVGKNEEL